MVVRNHRPARYDATFHSPFLPLIRIQHSMLFTHAAADRRIAGLAFILFGEQPSASNDDQGRHKRRLITFDIEREPTDRHR